MATTVITDHEFTDWESRKTGCRGTRIAIAIDRPTNDVLMSAIQEMGVTKRDYVKQAYRHIHV